jgi:hypothetical protein
VKIYPQTIPSFGILRVVASSITKHDGHVRCLRLSLADR